ncbi:MAG TPA: hypothetical protein PKH27_04955 [Candidatus Desulfobacillus denitrificans]|jgi:hypothetical protein|nr:hypothetical protein [Candidatus Desulfobacillus denitrificans]HNT63597.1 hypothetical protein [Candidatus Desulfobacillus denitrificans]
MKSSILALPLLLAGCMNESATYYLDGREQSLTLQAKQPWFWDQRVDLEVVLSRLPDCQRRSRLDGAMPAEIALEVLRPEAGEFAEPILILRQGGRHYALGLANCELQAFAAAPQKPGALLGAFRMEGRQLKFNAAAAPKPPPAPAAATPAAAPQ